MLHIISSVFTVFAFATMPAVSAPTVTTEHGGGCPNGCGGGLGLDIALAPDIDIDIDLGDCFDIDVDLGASCAIVADIDAALYCNPLSVEAACIAHLGLDCGLDAFLGCVADMTAHCEAEIEAGGALFCDGVFVGADACLGGLGIDVDIDLDECFDVDLDVDVDIDLGLCLDLDVGLDLDCGIKWGAACYAACSPVSVEAACIAKLGEDCSFHDLVACQAELIAQCEAGCAFGGSLFCDGDLYAGSGFCL